MLKKSVYIIILISFCSLIKISCQIYSLNGFICDSISGEPLTGALIFDTLYNKIAASNEFGYFNICYNDSVQRKLIVSYIGYENKTIHSRLLENNHFKIYLKPKNYEIKEITVKGPSNRIYSIYNNNIQLSVKQINSIPLLAGERDICKALQLLPGIQGGSEGNSGLIVRGSPNDQNLILIDDANVYYTCHFNGFFSVFNSDAINSFNLYKSWIPARYGGRSSSVLDIKLKEGNLKKFTAKGSIGLISSSVAIEGPIIKDTSSFIITTRLFNFGLLTKTFNNWFKGSFLNGYTFFDINSKVNYIFSDKSRLFLSFYNCQDKSLLNFKINDNENQLFKTQWGNFLFSSRFYRVLSNKLFSNIILTYNNYKYLNKLYYQNDSCKNGYNFENNTHLNDFALKINLEHKPVNYITILYGFQSIYHIYNIDKISNNQVNIKNQISSDEFHFYIENNFFITNKINSNIGLHSILYYLDDTIFYSFEPRIIFSFNITKDILFKTTFTKASQFIHNISSNINAKPSDYWLPVTRFSPPSEAKQFSCGINISSPQKKIIFDIEAYYKKMEGIICIKEGERFNGSKEEIEKKLNRDIKGFSQGIESLIEINYSKIFGWLGYTLSKTMLINENINNGIPFPYDFDRRHKLDFMLSYTINSQIKISANWQYGSGYPLSLPVEKIYIKDDFDSHYFTIDIITSKNNIRMKAYHRLDIAIFYTIVKKRFTHDFNFSIYNLYNRQNAYVYYVAIPDSLVYSSLNDYKTKNNPLTYYQLTLFPFFPSINYSLSF